jgi:hypothetical protein
MGNLRCALVCPNVIASAFKYIEKECRGEKVSGTARGYIQIQEPAVEHPQKLATRCGSNATSSSDGGGAIFSGSKGGLAASI